MNKLVIFDLDGTLLDTVPDIADNVNIMLEKFGLSPCTLEQIKKYIGNGAKKLVQRSIGKELPEQEFNARHEYFVDIYAKNGTPKTKLFDGIGKVLTNLKERGYKLAILTNKPQGATDNVYQTYLKDFGFDMVIGQSGSVKCKPDKTATLKILTELDVLPENCYFVGDGETDVLTAINSGTNGIAVLWGYREKSQLLDAGATLFASNPIDLLNIIK